MDEYKLKLQKVEKELGIKTAELLQKNAKVNELQERIKRDEVVLKKLGSENEKLKRGTKVPVPVKEKPTPSYEEMKGKFMDSLSNQLETIFEEEPELLDDKTKIKQGMQDLLQKEWMDRIDEVRKQLQKVDAGQGSQEYSNSVKELQQALGGKEQERKIQEQSERIKQLEQEL